MVRTDHASPLSSWWIRAMSPPLSGRTVSCMTEIFDTIVIGGGQAGLSVGYYLKKHGRRFVILDANEEVGGSWRTRTWDSLRLFTPARYDGLPGDRKSTRLNSSHTVISYAV